MSKSVFKTREIPHVWAHPRTAGDSEEGYAQSHGHNPQKNLFFDTRGDSRILYSYRQNYPIGNTFLHRGERVFLVYDADAYSVTTAGHMSACKRAAVGNGKVFYVPDVVADYRTGEVNQELHETNVAWMAGQFNEMVARFIRMRAPSQIEWTHTTLTGWRVKIQEYAELFQVEAPTLLDFPDPGTGRLAEARRKESERTANKRAKREEENRIALAKCQEAIDKWKRGESLTPSYGWNRISEFAFLRVITVDGVPLVETSHGARVAINGHAGAARLLHFLENLKATGKTFQANGHAVHIGEFTLRSFDGTVLTVGCHRIEWSEITRVAPALRAVANIHNVA